MWIGVRIPFRKRMVVVSSLTLFMGMYLGLHLLSQVAILKRPLPLVVSEEEVRQRSPIEYTLPSLEDVMNSVVDLDLQRVLASFKHQHEQIPRGTLHVKVVIASTWRSGSTFLAEIISAYPGVFYHYEPLMSYGINQAGDGKDREYVVGLLSSLLNCNYTDKMSFLQYAYGNADMFSRNKRLWNMCKLMTKSKCYVPENIGKLCSLFPVQVMKLVRAKLSVLAPLLQENVKIIWLIRDPRAVISSRLSSVSWCTSKICKQPKHLCSNHLDDFNTYSQLKKSYPDQVMILRYEDLAKDPYRKTELVLQFIGLSMHQQVSDYLKRHLSDNIDSPWSTIHNPEIQAKKWMNVASWNTIVDTQYYCRNVMKLLGYRPFDSKRDLAAGNAVQLLNIS